MDVKDLDWEQGRLYDEERSKYSFFPWSYLEEVMRKVGVLDALMGILRDVQTHLMEVVRKKEYEVAQADINSVDYVLARIDSGVSARYRELAMRRLNNVFMHRHDAECALEELNKGYYTLQKQLERWSISIQACMDEMLERNGIKFGEN